MTPEDVRHLWTKHFDLWDFKLMTNEVYEKTPGKRFNPTKSFAILSNKSKIKPIINSKENKTMS